MTKLFGRMSRLIVGGVAVSVLAWVATAWPQCWPIYKFTGYSDLGHGDGHLGRSIAGVGDIDKDGFADIIVGGWDLPPYNAADPGRAVVYSGGTGKMLHRFIGEPIRGYYDFGDGFGLSVAGAGDVNGDGFPDIIVGAPEFDPTGHLYSYGRAYVFSGKDYDTLYVFTGQYSRNRLGAAVAGAGDVNGDGYADLLIGVPRTHASGWVWGVVEVRSGRDGSLLYELAARVPGDAFGVSVAGIGDVNGDGFADLVVGAPDIGVAPVTLQGHAYVFSGRDGSLLYRFSGEGIEDRFGTSVAGIGDMDGDGTPDVAVGAIWNDSGFWNGGRVYVYSGRSGQLLRTFSGEHVDDWFGQSVAGIGDVDGDGFADLLVGATGTDVGAPDAGAAYVYSGRTGAKLWEIAGEGPEQWLGTRVSGVGDVNRDGMPDWGVTAPGYDGLYSDVGRAYVFMPCRMEVDILPGQCPNVLDLRVERSVLVPEPAVAVDPWVSVAVLGSPSLDVRQIRPTSVLFAGQQPVRWLMRDVSGPAPVRESGCDCGRGGPDGYLDLELAYRQADVVRALAGDTNRGPLPVSVGGQLASGTPLIGSDCLTVLTGGWRVLATAVLTDSVRPLLLGNHPNPFNAATVIGYRLSASGPVRLEVFDVLGRQVCTLADGRQGPGSYRVVWDGTDGHGAPASSGVYFCRLDAGGVRDTREMVLLR